MYEQIDSVSMGSCLAPVLANIIPTEFEKLVNDLVTSGILKFHRRYVDDTLVLMTVSDIPFVLNKFNSFVKNLKFTVDTSDSGKVHFLDLEISQSGINIYRKPTHTGQYMHFDSFEPWTRKMAWVRSLSQILQQILQISKFMAWNGFTAQIRSSIIRKLKLRFLDGPKQANDNDAFEDIRPKILIRIPYLGRKGEFLEKKLVKKFQRNSTEPVKFVVLNQTKKISYYLPKKDKVPDLQQSNLIYKFTCPGCNESYIGKTERNLNTRLKEQFGSGKERNFKTLYRP